MGYAIWEPQNVVPIEADVSKISQKESWIDACHLQATFLYHKIISNYIEIIICEFTEFWQSAKSFTSVKRGDIFKLSYLIGSLGEISWKYCRKSICLVTPTEWKGQLTKHAVDLRIKRAIGQEYSNHVSDAVGIGLSLLGKLYVDT